MVVVPMWENVGFVLAWTNGLIYLFIGFGVNEAINDRPFQSQKTWKVFFGPWFLVFQLSPFPSRSTLCPCVFSNSCSNCTAIIM